MKKTSLLHGTMYLTLSSAVFVVSGYALNIWLGRYLGPAFYGIYGVLITLISAINLTQTSGLPQAVAKFTAEDETHADGVLKKGLIIQIISTTTITLLLAFLSNSIARAFGDTSLTPYIAFSAAIFPLYGIYALYLNFYNGHHFFKTQAIMGIIYAITKLIAVILLVYFFHVYGVIVGFILAPLFALLFFIHFPTNQESHISYKKLILFSLPLTAVAIFSTLLQSIDLFFVKALMHANTAAGLYTASQNIAEIPFYAVISLASILFPGISKHMSQNMHEETKQLISHALRFSLLILVPSIFILSMTSTNILVFLYSSQYAEAGSALTILSIGSGFFTFFALFASIISSAGKPSRSMFLAGIGVFLSIFLCILLIPLMGLRGAALATTLAAGSIMIMASILVYKRFRVLFPLKSIVKIFVASSCLAFFSKIIFIPLIFLPFFYVFLFILYLILLIIMKELTTDDLFHIKKFIPVGIQKRIPL